MGNVAAAIASVVLAGEPLDQVLPQVATLTPVPGRLQAIPNSSGVQVIVDYAHTPDALRNVLAALTAMAGRRVLCVFGCGGDRDRGKRPQMGKIAAQMCDLAVVTSDNPRSEPPLAQAI